MPFQSEKQRRYLWANEPEIARDWADTYGSRIESNTGGISRLGFANGPNYQVDPNTINQDLLGTADYQGEEEEENPLEKFLRFMQGNAGNLSQADVNANTQFLKNYGVGFAPNNPYQMTSGPFKGMNAPGSSAMGSKTSQEMAQKWTEKYGGMDYQTEKQMAKQKDMRDMAAGNTNLPPTEKAQGGRIGYAQGNPHQDQDPGLGMSPGAAQARGLGAIHHGSTTSGNLHAGNVGGGNVGGNAGVNIGGSEVKKKPNILGGLRNIIPFLGKKGNWIGGALSIFDLMKQPPKTEDLILSADETTDDETDAEKLAKKIRNMEDFIANEKKKKAADIWKEFE
jgi:hypothetical protein